MNVTNPIEQDDGELLGRFAEAGEQSAFVELVNRHGGMVHAVARRVLGDAHEAEDVAQAAFLALARKARSLRRDPSVAGWLHRVGMRIALDVRKARIRRAHREEHAMTDWPRETNEETAEALREELDAAMDSLPEHYRQPLVLVHLEGMVSGDAAMRLALSPTVLRKRLERGREMLRRKLVRRGVAVGSVGALTTLLSAEAGAAVLPASFVSATAKAASLAAAGKLAAGVGTGVVSANVVALTKGAVQMMLVAKVQVVAAAVAACALTVGSIAVVAQQAGTPAQTNSWVTKPNGQVDINPLWGAFDRLDQNGELVIIIQPPAGQSNYRPASVELRLKIAAGREEIVRNAVAGLAKGAKVKVGCVWNTDGRERFVWELAAMESR